MNSKRSTLNIKPGKHHRTTPTSHAGCDWVEGETWSVMASEGWWERETEWERNKDGWKEEEVWWPWCREGGEGGVGEDQATEEGAEMVWEAEEAAATKSMRYCSPERRCV